MNEANALLWPDFGKPGGDFGKSPYIDEGERLWA
jgi:hypothetical protein